MEALFNNWIQQTRNRITRLLWDQWSLLGVSGNRDQIGTISTRHPILDPEALLLATFIIARRDPRLFDEVLDWASRNGRWLSLQRMKNLSTEWASSYMDQAFAAFGAWMSGIDRKGRWKAVPSSRKEIRNNQSMPSETQLFLDETGQPHPILSEMDPVYLQNGLQRPMLRLRGMSQDVPMLVPEAFLFRMRSLFGLSPRAEVISVLMARGSETLTGLSYACGYSRSSLIAVLADFRASGELREEKCSGSKRWRINEHALLHAWKDSTPKNHPLMWFQWLPIYRALHLLDDTLKSLMQPGMTIPAMNAALCVLSDNLERELSDVGFPSPFHTELRYEEAFLEIQERVDMLFIQLSGHG